MSKVTMQQIESEISSEHYFTAADGMVGANPPFEPTYESCSVEVPAALCLLTFCVLVLKNGFTVTGESACADPAIFDAVKGRAVARAAAIAKVWPLRLATSLKPSWRAAALAVGHV